MTPACRALDAVGVNYTIHPYDHVSGAESYGLGAAAALGLEPALVFKTLMAELDTGEVVVAIVPVTRTLDLKALARAASVKRASMADVAAAERVSGYVAGGISPFGQRTRRATFLDTSAADHNTIYVSGGRRGLDLGVDPEDLIDVLDATLAPIASL